MILTRELIDRAGPREGDKALVLLLAVSRPPRGRALAKTRTRDVPLAQAVAAYDEGTLPRQVIGIASGQQACARAHRSPEHRKKRLSPRDRESQHIAGRPIKKFVYVPGKIVNFILE
jgi:hypothetical protein